jgi:hypothetical protein
MAESNDASWAISPNVRATYSEDGAVLLDIDKGLCYSLNPVAARVWGTIEASLAGITLDGIVDALETHFEVSRKQLEEDTSKCLHQWQGLGLVQRNGRDKSTKAFGKGR